MRHKNIFERTGTTRILTKSTQREQQASLADTQHLRAHKPVGITANLDGEETNALNTLNGQRGGGSSL